VLIQYGNRDLTIPDAQRTELAKSAVGSKRRIDYDFGHDLINFGQARVDRLEFLKTALNLP
jgi:hypothetical protein